ALQRGLSLDRYNYGALKAYALEAYALQNAYGQMLAITALIELMLEILNVEIPRLLEQYVAAARRWDDLVPAQVERVYHASCNGGYCYSQAPAVGRIRIRNGTSRETAAFTNPLHY